MNYQGKTSSNYTCIYIYRDQVSRLFWPWSWGFAAALLQGESTTYSLLAPFLQWPGKIVSAWNYIKCMKQSMQSCVVFKGQSCWAVVSWTGISGSWPCSSTVCPSPWCWSFGTYLGLCDFASRWVKVEDCRKAMLWLPEVPFLACAIAPFMLRNASQMNASKGTAFLRVQYYRWHQPSKIGSSLQCILQSLNSCSLKTTPIHWPPCPHKRV